MAYLNVFHQGSGESGQLWVSVFDGTNWAPDTQVLNVGMSGSPSAVVFPGGAISVFHEEFGNSGQLWYSYFDGTNWQPDTQVPNVSMSGSPSVVYYSGNLYVFHQGFGESGQLWVSVFDGTNWVPDTQVPNVGMSGSPSAVVLPGGAISVFHQGSGNSGQLWYSYWNGTNWEPDTQVPNAGMSGSPSAVYYNGNIYVFHQGSGESGQLWVSVFDGTNWAPDTQVLNVGMSGSPSAVVFPDGAISVFHQGYGNSGQLWYSYFDGTNWQPDTQVSSEAGLTTPGMSESPGAIISPIPITLPARWMARLSDTSKLSQLTLPGTHDTCTAFLTRAASCQNWSLLDQLNHGIRCVDIRCRHIQDTFAIHHDLIFTGLFFGNDVRDVCVNFLTANTTECIVMQVKHEYTDENNTQTFQQTFDGYVQGFESFFYLDDRIPTLGEVRGKIVVVRRFDLDSNAARGLAPYPWQDNATFDVSYTAADNEAVTFHIQDQYQVPDLDSDNVAAKEIAFNDLLYRATQDASDAWYINFASGSSSALAFAPADLAAQINPVVYDNLASVGGGPFAKRGTLMLDFPDDNMIRKIISLN